MTDVFKEQLITRQTTNKDRMARVGLVFGVVFIFLVTMSIVPAFGMIVTIVATFGAYVINGRLKREFEYSLTNDELDIDVIYNRSSRKRLFSGSVKSFEIMAHLDDQDHARSFSTANERKDYSSGLVTERSYIFLTNYKSKKMAIIIEPNEEMLNAIVNAMTGRKFYPKR